MAMMLEEENVQKGVPISFGTTQDRKLFPHHCAFNRLGNLDGIRGETHLGPDKYNVDKVGSEINRRLLLNTPINNDCVTA